MILEPVDSPAPTGLARANSSINDTSPLIRQITSEDDFYMEEAVVADLDFCDSVVGGPTSTCLKSAGLIVDLAGGVTIGVSSPADLAEDVTVGMSSLADLAGGVAIGVVFSAVVEVASSADVAEVAFSADLADVASSADCAGDITVGVMSSAVAEVASSAASAGVAFQEECEVQIIMSCLMICMGRMTVGYIVYPEVVLVWCMGRMTVGYIVYPEVVLVWCMGRMTVGYIVYPEVVLVWCPTGVEMTKGTCMRAMLPYPGLVLMSRSMGRVWFD